MGAECSKPSSTNVLEELEAAAKPGYARSLGLGCLACTPGRSGARDEGEERGSGEDAPTTAPASGSMEPSSEPKKEPKFFARSSKDAKYTGRRRNPAPQVAAAADAPGTAGALKTPTRLLTESQAKLLG